ncbi:MAG: hypothetical protein WA147_00530 [Polaromonas sp.]
MTSENNSIQGLNRYYAYLMKIIAYARQEPLECIGALSGALGALLLSQNASYSKWGWISFLLSNVCLILMARKKRLYGLWLVQIYFSYTSLNGIFNYFR